MTRDVVLLFVTNVVLGLFVVLVIAAVVCAGVADLISHRRRFSALMAELEGDLARESKNHAG